MKVLARKFGIGQWSFIGPGSEKKWYSAENSPQGAWDNNAEEMLLEFPESGHSIFRVTTPLSRGILKSKGRGKLSRYTSLQMETQLIQFFALFFLSISSVSTEQWRLCQEFETHQGGSGEPDALMGQSIVLGEIKAEILLQHENPTNDQII